MLKRTLVTVSACATFAIAAAPAIAAPTSAGGVSDRQGDVKPPERDIVGVIAAYDPAGIVRAGVATAAPATAQTNPLISLMLGIASRSRGTCDIRFDLAMYPDPEEPFGGLHKGRRDLGLQKVEQVGTLMSVDTTTGDGSGPPTGPRPALAGARWNCAVAATYSPKIVRGDYALADDSGVFPLTTPTGGAAPVCHVDSGRVRRGGRLRLSCTAVTGKVTVRLHREKPRSARRTTVGADGRASVRVRRSVRRGGYIAAVWQGRTLLGSRSVRVR